MRLFQHKDRVIRQINDQEIELINGSPRIYVINKDQKREINTLYAYPGVRIDPEGLVIRANAESKWNIGDKVLFHHSNLTIENNE
jgi:hypothetical protein